MKEIKITFVNPPLSTKESAGSFEKVENVLPPLGLGYLSAVLENAGYYVRIIDCKPLRLDAIDLVEKLKKEKPDIIGLTSTVLEIGRSCQISNALKKSLPDSFIIIGGPHLTSLPMETMRNSAFDVGVIGEGENTMLELAERINRNELDFEKVDGIIYRENEELTITQPRGYIEDLDSLPFPARHLLPPLSEYSPGPASYLKLPQGHMMTSRGCPYQCIFCDKKTFGNKVRLRSPTNVVDEVRELIDTHGAKDIRFFDDSFTVDNDRIFKICEELDNQNIRIPWSCLTRVDIVSKELLQRMREAGCWQISFGLESGDQEILNKMKKGITIEKSRQAVRWAKMAGLDVRAYFILGMPGESTTSIRKTAEFARSLPIDTAQFYALTLFPGNELYEIAKREGTMLHDDYSKFNVNIDVDDSRLAYVPEGMTEQELKNAIRDTYKKFYLRPIYLLKQLISIRSFEDLKRYWKGCKTILNL